MNHCHFKNFFLPTGACFKDGRIKPDDILKMVNGRSLFALSSKEIIHLLHQQTERVTLMVARKKQPIEKGDSTAEAPTLQTAKAKGIASISEPKVSFADWISSTFSSNVCSQF